MRTTVAVVSDDDAARLAMVKALDHAPPEWMVELHRDPPPDADVVVCSGETEIEGAIVFAPGEVDLVASIAERIRRSGTSILVSGPSGGTGVTSVAVHLAAEFVASGRSTVLVDLDPGRGAGARLGLDPDAEPVAPVPVAGGFLLATPADQTLSPDRIVIDAGGRPIADADEIDAGVLVCSPSPQGARRCRSMLEAHPEISWHVVVNRLGPGGETTRSQFERLVGRAAIELACCPALRDAEDDGRLLARGWTRWSRSLARLAARLDA